MKVGIVTFHFVNNFGGALQAYALQNTIEKKCDTEATIIDYRNWFIRFTDTVRLLPITGNLREVMAGVVTMGQRIGRINKFKHFQQKYYKLTKRYGSSGSIRNAPPECDKYICGSDQIWNPLITAGVTDAYFLGFEKQGNKKISYAPSFGTRKFSKYQEKKIQNYVSNFGALSVREKEGVEWVKHLTGKEAVQLIDPTFLLTKEEWNKVAVDPGRKEKYILLYIMQRDEEVYRYARKLKETLQLPVIEISRYGLKSDFVDECLIDLGPAEFLGLFQHAECVCTNSYHGLVFSIIFGKQLCLIPCKRFRTRINNLLELLQIGPIRDLSEDDLLVEFPNEEILKQTIKEEREKSLAYLRQSIRL